MRRAQVHAESEIVLRLRFLRFSICANYNSWELRGMPKCPGDFALQDQMRRFIHERGLTVCGAADLLEVDRTTLWRFCRTAMAREDTRARYRVALANCNENVAVAVADNVQAVGPVSQPSSPVQGALAVRDLRQIRRACEGVLALLDVYESRLAVEKN
jgi:hypothetical protein